MKYGIAGLIVVLVLTWGLSELLLPGYYEKQVEASLREQVEKVELITVNISSRPAFLLLAGQVQHGSVQVKGVESQGLRIEELTARYENLVFSKTESQVKAIKGNNTFFKAVILEDDVEDYLQTTIPMIEKLSADLDVVFNSNQVILNFQIMFFGSSFDFELSGYFEIIDNYTIRYHPKDLKSGEMKLPSFITKALEELEFDLKLEQFLLPLVLNEIYLEGGKLFILGGSRQ
ncbi:MAG: DUF2993 domain-containing protein [Halanaerobiales bacterium]|nr:DUF2993 domain-containing protein [Halanaerobiales bacterium]